MTEKKRIPLSERADLFRRKRSENSNQGSDAVLTPEQQNELYSKAGGVLKKLLDGADRFLVSEQFDMQFNPGLTTGHLTPYVHLAESTGPDEYAILSLGHIEAKLGGVSPSGSDEFGEHYVIAGVLLRSPEDENPDNVFSLGGMQNKDGTVNCTSITCIKEFFRTNEDRQNNTPFNWLNAVNEMEQIAESLTEALTDTDPQPVARGKVGHNLTVIEKGRITGPVFIPHKKQ